VRERLLHVSNPSPGFLGVKAHKDRPDAYIIGFPYDSTVCWRPGSRFGPSAIREASLNIETYSYRYKRDAEDLFLEDLGDLSVVPGDTQTTLSRLEETFSEVRQENVPIVMLGGEHIGTYSAVKSLRPDLFIVFDAHTDMRDEYLSYKLSHATTSRRVAEAVGPDKMIQVGVRASCKQELAYIEQNGVSEFSSFGLHKGGIEYAISQILKRVEESRRVYVSVDLDVLDPAFMAGVGTPEAEGLSIFELNELLGASISSNLTGFDVMELNPMVDSSGVSAAVTGRIVLEAVTKMALWTSNS
jgi:agmatinase